MRAHPGRLTTLMVGLAAAGLVGCRAPGLGDTASSESAALAEKWCTGPAAAATGKIAFMSDRTGNYEIFTMNADGSDVRQLTNNPDTDDHPAWSPDGTKIAFTISIGMLPRDIFTMNADGTGVTQLTHDPADDHEMAWSPDGTKIVFASKRTGNYEIFVMNADGTGLAQLTHDPTADREPAWSPDGTRIAYSSDGSGRDGITNYDVFVMKADGTGAKKLTKGGADDQNPAWSPDGTKITWRVSRTQAGKLLVMNADGSEATELLEDPATTTHTLWSWSPDGSPAWSPDGAHIALSSTRAGNTDIFLMDADGCGVTNLTNNGATDDEPAWQPRSPEPPAPASPAPTPAVLPATT